MSERSYLDWNATAPMREGAEAAFVDALSVAGNPSSVHAEGRAARLIVETAREKVAALVGAHPANVLFVSSGTEAARAFWKAVRRVALSLPAAPRARSSQRGDACRRRHTE